MKLENLKSDKFKKLPASKAVNVLGGQDLETSSAAMTSIEGTRQRDFDRLYQGEPTNLWYGDPTMKTPLHGPYSIS